MTGGCFGFGGGAGGNEVLVAALLLGHLLAECLQLLGLGAEAADLYASGFLGNEITHERDFLMGWDCVNRLSKVQIYRLELFCNPLFPTLLGLPKVPTAQRLPLPCVPSIPASPTLS